MTAPTIAPAALTLPPRIFAATSGWAARASSTADSRAVSSETTSSPRASTTSLGSWPGGLVVAEGIDLDLGPGDWLAVVGPSGIGKMMLLLTLAGMLRPRAGELTLDGVAPWGAARGEVAGRVSLTAEDAHVFSTSVLENLRVARGSVSRPEAAALLERAGLGPWLTALPEGLDTEIGPDATTLSGGERRRLLLARALATPTPLMLLNKPSEHLNAH